ncbi:MAG: response regulator transcription factor [Chloroflexi bacterium]|nr:response regulator transcription factor [Chloroflexota bacterium]MCH8200478.1 response regulator transcription factor [Chloroflexota bacterium]MCI0784178.1 response regulator transcription factor [Chloroflexota bacterium]MCI0815011.1 response regulator transcription factor [Chloroflexota bacterium]MCI0817320.1 response regulator transcription factor [Chloroflexota bacterium]
MAEERVLVVEDEPMVAEVVERYLRRDGYTVSVVHDGDKAMDAFERFQPDLIVLDLMLPGLDGTEICRRVRARSQTSIIMLTARGEETDKIVGLGMGADDYVTKPFSPRELAARVKAVLRRAKNNVEADGDHLRFGDLRINGRTRKVEDHRGPIELTAREFDLLFHLASHPEQVFSREQLLDAVWDLEFPGDASTVTVSIRRLRSKVETDPSRPRHLKTVWGVGYKFEP